MRTFKYFFYLLAIAISFSSCSITEEVTFNKDYSGTYSLKLDMGQFITSMQAFGNDTIAKSMNSNLSELDQSASEFNEIEGISNAEVISDQQKYIYGIKFDFSDIEALNRSKTKESGGISQLVGGESEPSEEHVYFKRKGKKITYELPKSQSDDSEIPMELLSSSKYKIIFRAAGEIKKANNDAYIISDDNKKAEAEIDFSEMLSKEGAINVTLKVK